MLSCPAEIACALRLGLEALVERSVIAACSAFAALAAVALAHALAVRKPRGWLPLSFSWRPGGVHTGKRCRHQVGR